MGRRSLLLVDVSLAVHCLCSPGQGMHYLHLLCIATEHSGLLWNGVLILEGLMFLSGR